MTAPVDAPASFPTAPQKFLLRGPAGAIEVASAPPLEVRRDGVALICHPHPLFGGTMDNKVVTTIERALRELGLATLRFNFRGVGGSEGAHDDGVGEGDDLRVVADWARSVLPDAVLWLAGFSFGSYVAARMTAALAPAQLISVAPPVGRWRFDAIAAPACPWLVIQGEDDDVVEPNAVYEWIAHMSDPPRLIRLPATGHFFHGKLTDLRAHLHDALRGNLPPLRG